MRTRDWLRCSDPARMVEPLWRIGHFIGTRPYDLFVLTAGARLWADPAVAALQTSVELVRLRAEGEAVEAEVARQGEAHQRLWDAAWAANDWHMARMVNILSLLLTDPASAARVLVIPQRLCPDGPTHVLSPAELLDSCRLMREIFGSPGGPGRPHPAWLTTAVVGIAQGIHADRAFDRLPVLADALEDAGCADKTILAHCRGPGPHLPGCWVVDLFTGRA